MAKRYIARQAEIQAQRNAEAAARFATMTDAAIASELMVLMDESVELTRTWGRDGSDAWCCTVAGRLTERINAARTELANRRQSVAA